MKHIKKSLLALGQLQLTLNHARHMLSYGEICQDHGKAKEHLKEALDSFAKVAKKAEKQPLFGEKFKRAVIDMGTLSKQLKEARHQFERPKPKLQPWLQKEPRYQSPLQRVQPEQQQATQSAPRTSYNQPFPSDPTKKASGRGRGGRYASTKHNTCLHSGQRVELHHCTGVGVARTVGGQLSARTDILYTGGGISGLTYSRGIPRSGISRYCCTRCTWRSSDFVPKKLGESNSQPLGTQCRQDRVSDRMGTEACAVKASSSANVQPRVECSGRPGGNGDVGKRSDYNSSASSGTVYKYVIPGREERGWFQTGHKFEKAEPSGEVRTVPNGRFGDTHTFSPGGRVSVQARPQRCVLYDINASEGSQVFPFSMEGEAVRVPGASFRSLFSPKSIHSCYESADDLFKEACFQKRGVPRQFLSHQFRGNGPIKDAGQSMVSVQAGLCYKLEEIVSSPHPERWISAVCERYDPTDDLSATREGSQYHSSVYGSIEEEVLLDLRTLGSLIGKLQNASTAILPAPLHYRFMKMSSIKGLARNHQNYMASVDLTGPVFEELRWWVRNLRSWNGKSFINPDPRFDVVITTDASLSGCRAECQGTTNQGQWSEEERTQHINVLQLKAAKLALNHSHICGRAVVSDSDWTTRLLRHIFWRWYLPGRWGV